MANYDKGQLVRVSVTFTIAGVDTDPTALTLEITDPAGALTTKALGDVANDATGKYHFDHGPVTVEGRYNYQWSATSGVVAASTGVFWVRKDLAL